MALIPFKLHPPRPRPDLVARPRLTRAIEANLWRRLTLLSAPAGSGKTTAAAAWARQTEATVAWLSLEPADGRPERLLVYLVAALRAVDPDLSPEVDALLDEGEVADLPSAVDRWVAGPLHAAREPFALVLDDLHVLGGSPAAMAGLRRLLEHLPPSMHLVVTTRREPDLGLPLLRARGEVLDLGAEALRFSSEEAAAFYNDALGLGLDPATVEALEARVEGWAAGARLGATLLARRPPEERAAVVAALERQPAVGAFLMEEVFARQPERVREALLRTAPLDRLCAPLVEALTDAPGEAILRELVDRNLFLVELGGEPGWRRHHHLFGQWLRRRLAKERPEALPDLHRRAARWFADAGRREEAVAHAAASGDEALLTALVVRWGMDALTRSEQRALAEWLALLPEAARDADGAIALLDAWVALLQNDPAALATLGTTLDRAEAAGVPEAWRGHLPALRRMAAVDLTRPDLAAEALTGGMEPGQVERDPLPWSVVHLMAGTMALILGQDAEAEEALGRASALADAAGNTYVSVAARAGRARRAHQAGRLEDAARHVNGALEAAEAAGLADRGLTSDAHLMRAALAHTRGDAEAAEAALARAESRLALTGDHTLTVIAGALRAELAADRGDLEAAREAVGRARAAAERHPTPVNEAWASAAASELDRRTGGATFPGPWAPHLSPSAPRVPGIAFPWDLLRVRWAVSTGHPEAQGLLDTLRAESEGSGRRLPWLHWQIAHAALAEGRGERAEALATLEEAVEVGRAIGARRPFTALEGLWRPLAAALPDGAQRWLSGTAAPTRPAPAPPQPEPPPAPITTPSPRELEVLRLIARGMTNAEIAEALYVAVGTVKTHVHRVLGKLEARNRVEAIRVARAHGLLDL